MGGGSVAGADLDRGRGVARHLEGHIVLRMADDDVAVGEEGLPPVAARCADGEEIDARDMSAVAGKKAVEPVVARDAALTLRAAEDDRSVVLLLGRREHAPL